MRTAAVLGETCRFVAAAMMLTVCTEGGTGGSDAGSAGATSTGGGGAGHWLGGAGGFVGTSGAGGSAECNGTQCKYYSLSKFLQMPACCSTNGGCGVQLNSHVAGMMGGIPTICYETDQVGELDCACPAFSFKNPSLSASEITYAGCCKPSGDCGYFIDVSSWGGPKIGCQLATWGAGVGKSCTPDSGATCDAGTIDASTD